MTQEQQAAAAAMRRTIAQTMGEGTRAAQLLDTTASALGIRPSVKLFAGFYLAIMTAYSREKAINPEIDEDLQVAFDTCLKHVHEVIKGDAS